MSDYNEPAFPQTTVDSWDKSHVRGGMTLRDYFAGQALAGWMCDPSANPCEKVSQNHMAEHCYGLADAMLRARQGGDS